MRKLRIKKNLQVSNEEHLQAFEALRANIQYYTNDAKVVAVTGCTDKDGKTFIAYRTAALFAADNKKTILVSTDCRKSIGSADVTIKGLYEVLEGRLSLDKAIFETDIDNMFIMFSGDRNGEKDDKIDESIFGNLIQTLKNNYEYIIIDTSTLYKTKNDLAVLKACDAAVLVLQPGKVAKKMLLNVKKSIEETGCNFAGVIFNNSDNK